MVRLKHWIEVSTGPRSIAGRGDARTTAALSVTMVQASILPIDKSKQLKINGGEEEEEEEGGLVGFRQR